MIKSNKALIILFILMIGAIGLVALYWKSQSIESASHESAGHESARHESEKVDGEAVISQEIIVPTDEEQLPEVKDDKETDNKDNINNAYDDQANEQVSDKNSDKNSDQNSDPNSDSNSEQVNEATIDESPIEEDSNQIEADSEEDEMKESLEKEASNEAIDNSESTAIFEINPISDDLKEKMLGNSYHENNQISFEDLRCVNVAYYGFDGLPHQGDLIVHEAIADKIVSIFKTLYEASYPIEKIEPVDAYGGDDHASMVANNTSAFNFRLVSGTDRLSNHAYGLAIDINPLINPYVTSQGVSPQEGERYADRDQEIKGMIHKGDLCYNTFIENGFSWGGNWINSKDYQHFDIKIEGINQ